MTTDEVLAIAKERGVEFFFGADGKMRVRGPRGTVTESLVRVLKFHSARIRDLHLPQVPKQYLWRFGQTQEFVGDKPPTGAWWWRHRGEAEWRGVPGTPGETQSPPDIG